MSADWYDDVFEDQSRFGLKVKRRLFAQQSPFQMVEILDTYLFGRVLVLDGIFQTSEADEHFYHEMLVHPALVTASTPRHVLLIGGGDGGTAREVLRHPEVERLTMVEIDETVVTACRRYLQTIGTAWEDPRLALEFGDGVAYVKAAEPGLFDVIILDGSDPTGPSEGLFDKEFYHACERALKPHGIMALQSESYFLMEQLFLDIQRALRGAFPVVHPYFGIAPLYGTGMWSWTYATRDANPRKLDRERIERIERVARYYNEAIHRAAFVLPNEIERVLSAL